MSETSAVSYSALEQLERSIIAGGATEAFGFAVRLFDNFNRLLRNLRVTLLNPGRALKRSELKAYHDAHTYALTQFFQTRSVNYEQLIPIPSGMKVSYSKATTALDTLYKTLAIAPTTATLLQFFDTLSLQTSRVDIDKTTSLIDHLSKEETETALQAVFSADKTHDVAFSTVINGFDELIALDQHILGYAPIFQMVELICNNLAQIETAIDRIVSTLENQPTIDKSYVRSLYQLIKTASVQFDMYGVLLAEMQRIEHNFVLVLKQLLVATPKK